MLEKITNALEHVVKKQGDISSFLIYPLLIIVVFEVAMRYALNSPTIWAFEATTFLYGLHYMFGLAYTDVYDGHVKVDIFTSMASDKTQTILRIFTNLVLFMPVIGCMTLWSIKFAYISTRINVANMASVINSRLMVQFLSFKCVDIF